MQEKQNQIPETVPANADPQPGRVRQLFRHSAIYSLSTSVQRLQGLIMTPIYTSTIYLPQTSQYGNYGLIYTFIAFMNFVYLYGMDAAFLRFFFLGKNSRRTVFSTTFLILLATGMVTSVLLILFAVPISSLILFTPGLAPYVRLAALILFFDTIGNLPFLILRAEERAVAFTVFRMLRFTMELLLNILFVVILKKGVIGILYANLFASLFNLVVMAPFAFKYFHFSFNTALLKEMVWFGLPFLPNGIAYMTIEMVDRFLVTDYLGKDVLAFYHANYKYASVLLLLIVGFRNAWQPFFLKIAKDTQARHTYSRILNYYLLLAGVVALFVTFFIRDLLTLHYFGAFYLLGTKYWEGIGFIPWIVLSYVFYGIYVIFTPAFFITKKSKYMVIFTGAGAILNIVTNILLLPRIGIWGAVIATVLAYFTMAFSIAIVAQKIYPIPVNLRKIGIMLLSIGAGYLVYYIMPLNFLWRSMVFILLITCLVFTILSPEERSRLKIPF